MHGSNLPNSLGSFGVQGVAAPANDPPALYEAVSWTDLNGNFWMFGGLDINTQEYAALWKYDPIANMWTWMNGPNTTNSSGNYGVQGVPAPANNPGARAWGSTAWTDSQGRLWMFGGSGYDANGVHGLFNDLWMYDVTTNLWTWMAGPNTVNNVGNYGVQLVPTPANLPPSRYENNASWTDNTGNLWIFGGANLFLNQAYSDMWMFDITINMWTWMAGSNAPNVPVNFGVQQVASPNNTPGARIVYGKWKDCQGNFWIFGGKDFANTGSNWADMWKFDLATLQWTWMAGSNVLNFAGSFNTQCVAGAQSPAARYENRTCWTDLSGRFWQYGGLGINTENDLWMFDPNTNQFTWVSGLLNGNAVGTYGVMGVPAAANNPEGLFGGSCWIDLQGDFWMFGGFTGQSNHSALWRYQQDPNCPGPGNPNSPPTALFTSNPDTGCMPLTVNFTSGNLGNFVYHWDFGDPNATNDTSNTNSSSYTYTATGTFVVSMIINGTSLCVSGIDTAYDTVVVFAPPLVDLGNDTLLCPDVQVLLDAGNPGATYQWNTG
ncbi:MAG: kelch repeat-containing protein, partial [Bacteroidia bacterium]